MARNKPILFIAVGHPDDLAKVVPIYDAVVPHVQWDTEYNRVEWEVEEWQLHELFHREYPPFAERRFGENGGMFLNGIRCLGWPWKHLDPYYQVGPLMERCVRTTVRYPSRLSIELGYLIQD